MKELTCPYCGADIVRVKSADNGKRADFDAEPGLTGTHRLDGGQAHYVPPEGRVGPLYRSHRLDCLDRRDRWLDRRHGKQRSIVRRHRHAWMGRNINAIGKETPVTLEIDPDRLDYLLRIEAAAKALWANRNAPRNDVAALKKLYAAWGGLGAALAFRQASDPKEMP